MNKKCLDSRHRGTRVSGSGPASHMLVEKVWGGRALSRLFGIRLPKGKLIGECWLYNDEVVIKIIDVRRPLSVQVHPSGEKGKSELWYIIEAGKGARVLGGITLDEYKIKPSDWIYLPGGTVHTILPPAVLLEISQNNLTTYRLYDWGRGTRPLDIEKGLKALDINAKPKIYRKINSFSCPYFKVRLMKGHSFRINGVCLVLKGIVKVGDRILRKGEALLVKDIVHALAPAVVFSVSWITRSSRIRRCGRG